MKYGRIENGVAIEVVNFDPAVMFTADIAALFEPIDDSAESGATFIDGQWVAPAAAVAVVSEPKAPALRKKLTPPEFKMQFMPTERLAIRAARQAAPGSGAQALGLKAFLDDFYDIVDDPRLTTVDLALPQTQQGVGALATFGLIDAERVPVILAGIVE